VAVLVVDEEREAALCQVLAMAGYDTVPLGGERDLPAWLAPALERGPVLSVRPASCDGAPAWLEFAGVALDPMRGGATVGEQFVELTRIEYRLLSVLMLHARRVLPQSVIYERVWGYDFGKASNGLRVYIGYLRRKLARAEAPVVIRTVRGVGYSLREG
jgi:DNA-binding response OmpR family regulator